MIAATLFFADLPPWAIPDLIDFDSIGALLWWLLKMAAWLASLFFCVMATVAAADIINEKGVDSGSPGGFPVVMGILLWIGLIFYSREYGSSCWTALGISFVFLLLGSAFGFGKHKFLVPAAVIAGAVWYYWPWPMNYAIALKDVVVGGVSAEATKLWNDFAGNRENLPADPGIEPEIARFLKRGIEQIRADRTGEAIASFRSAHQLDPLCPEPLLNLGMAYETADQTFVAMCWYEAYLRVAPQGQTRRAVVARLSAVDEELRQDLRLLANAASEIAAAQVGGESWGDLQQIARVKAQFGDIDGALALLEKLRSIDPGDQHWSESCMLVAYILADLGAVDVAESFVTRIKPQLADFLRQKISDARSGNLNSGSAGSFATYSDREAIQWWSEYADSIPGGDHHRHHALDDFGLDLAVRPVPGPEMGIGPYLDGLIRRQERRASSLTDGLVRMYFTRREIRRRSFSRSVALQETPSGPAPTLAEVMENSNQFLEQVLQSAEPGTIRK